MVSIETKEEMEFLLKRLRLVFPKRRNKALYIGLFVEESPWEWVNGKPLTYDRWERGQTYNSAPNLNQYSYAHMYLFPSHFRYGDFNDHRDYLKQSSICEIPANRYNGKKNGPKTDPPSNFPVKNILHPISKEYELSELHFIVEHSLGRPQVAQAKG